MKEKLISIVILFLFSIPTIGQEIPSQKIQPQQTLENIRSLLYEMYPGFVFPKNITASLLKFLDQILFKSDPIEIGDQKTSIETTAPTKVENSLSLQINSSGLAGVVFSAVAENRVDIHIEKLILNFSKPSIVYDPTTKLLKIDIEGDELSFAGTGHEIGRMPNVYRYWDKDVRINKMNVGKFKLEMNIQTKWVRANSGWEPSFYIVSSNLSLLDADDPTLTLNLTRDGSEVGHTLKLEESAVPVIEEVLEKFVLKKLNEEEMNCNAKTIHGKALELKESKSGCNALSSYTADTSAELLPKN